MIIKSQNGQKVYSDGTETEQRMYEIAKNFPEDLSQDYISKNYDYTTNNTFSGVRHNILNWYDFKEGANVLEVGAGMGSITGMLCDKCNHVTAVEMNEVRANIIRTRFPNRKNLTVVTDNINNFDDEQRFDYVVFVGVLEYAGVFSNANDPYVEFLCTVEKLLKDDGILLFAIENRFGLRYWCGASEDHLQLPFVGINGYVKDGTPKTFSKFDLECILDKAGLSEHRFYNVLPDYKFPNVLFTDEWKLNYTDVEKIPFTYGKNSILTVNEKKLYRDIIDNDVSGFFANSFLVEATKTKLPQKHKIFITGRGECKKEFKIVTTIDSDGTVTKIPANKYSEEHLNNTLKNEIELSKNGVEILESKLINGKLVLDFFKGTRADIVFEDYLFENDLKNVFKLIDLLKINLLKSSEISKEKITIIDDINFGHDNQDYGIILKKGFMDMTFYNSFYQNHRLIFFDQEWSFDNIPLNFILYYATKTAYFRSKSKTKISFESILAYIGVSEEKEVYDKLEEHIWSKVMYRQGDFYGEGGYCRQFDKEMTLEDKLIELDAHKKLKEELNNKEGHINQLIESERELKQELNNKEGHINQLLEKDRELERIKESRSWRYMGKIWKIRDFFIPKESKLRLFVKILVKFIKHPIKFMKKASPKKIKKFFYLLKKDGITSVSNRIDDALIGTKINKIKMDISKVEEKSKKTFEDYSRIEISNYRNPKVSIVIPVYNEFEHTYNCIKSISKHSEEVEYEIIIANDCSTDLTMRINEIVTGISVISNEENLGFLKNCNNAAKHAKGKYILFLNNDTQVQENWLIPLINLIESDSKIGMVGSKLIYPDGRLQEAGGIYWKDGSAWNYGNRSNPDEPEYNYVKEVDYISGAAMMLLKDLWEEVEGFDERFVPAYCEDSDLAFAVRSKGYKVMYQPLSVVVHFEGVSNGTDVSSGVKSYQIVNQKKLYEKWKHLLEKEHFENGKHVFQARDRTRNKKTILVIDHYVPHYDKDAGSRTVYQYLKLFVSMGFNVKFIGDNFFKHEPYTSELQQMGIEVLYGNYYENNWKNWIKINAEYIDFVFLNRPHISVKYIDFIKSNTDAKIIYYGHDLHFLREMREYELTGNRDLIKTSEYWKNKELSLMRKADVVYYPSIVEENEIKTIDNNINVKSIPAYIFDDVDEILYNIADRNDIMFIGGFNHKPNVDAVIWLAEEIYPIVSSYGLGIKFYIIGSNPPDEIKKYANENFIIKGFIDDDELEKYYNTSRLSIVPLRYGAGIKGKVVEAMKHGIPVITTRVGSEGIIESEEFLCIAESAVDFADKIIYLYNNEVKLSDMSIKSKDYVSKIFNVKNVLNIIGEDFDF